LAFSIGRQLIDPALRDAVAEDSHDDQQADDDIEDAQNLEEQTHEAHLRGQAAN
jgi:hypothetical protein